MYRRRIKPRREVAFGFDSFLDVVANVIGIIVRLILVAWVGGRAYNGAMTLSATSTARVVPEIRQEDDPLFPQLAQIRADLNKARATLVQDEENAAKLQSEQQILADRVRQIAALREQAERESKTLVSTVQHQAQRTETVALSIQALQERSKALAKEVEAAKIKPIKTKTLNYRVPVSRPVMVDELHFECKEGRVTFVDLQGFIAEIKLGLAEKADRLKTQWQVTETTSALGGFRLRYTVERERGTLDALVSGGMPRSDAAFGYTVSSWVAEPLSASRGETLERALAAGSKFRTCVATADKHTVVTFWVYPDSFDLFRRLRECLYDRGAEVAARPLPEGVPIAASKHGTASRGQ